MNEGHDNNDENAIHLNDGDMRKSEVNGDGDCSLSNRIEDD